MSSPSARSKAYMAKQGYIVGTVERYCSFTRRRHDLFGFIDLIAVRGQDVVGIQTTSDANLAARIAKAEALPEFPIWLRAGRVEFHGWGKKGGKGKRKMWSVRVVSREKEKLSEVPDAK